MSSFYSVSDAAVYCRHRGVQSGVLRALLALPMFGEAAGRVLEIGCGTANHLRALVDETGCLGWGVDPSGGMLSEGRGAGAALWLGRARAEALPFPDRSFDLAFSVDVVHHIGDLDAAFAEASRVLHPGGMLLTATDSRETIRARTVLSGYFPETVPHELARYPSEDRLLSLHRQCGFEILDAFVVEHPYILTDTRALRERAYSCLHLISDAALVAGVARVEKVLPLATVSRNYVIVARR